MIKEAISKLVEGKNLDFTTTRKVFLEILEKKVEDFEIAAFLVALKMKGETDTEISAAASVIREKAKKIYIKEEVMDTCGTGGSGLNKFNISTTVAFVVASSGLIKVAKHGNRGISSKCGSADLLERLGININVSPKVTQKLLRKVGVAFLFAPLYHPAFKNVASVRRGLKIKTIFNILGPLCNPAGASYQILGVSHPDLVLKVAKTLRRLKAKKACVFYSEDLRDEVGLSKPTYAIFLENRKLKERIINPKEFGLRRYLPSQLKVKNAGESARIFLEIIEGKRSPYYDVVLANSSLSFYLLGKVNNLKEGVAFSEKLIREGRTKEKFLKFKRFLESGI